jgi:hypothetical protein
MLLIIMLTMRHNFFLEKICCRMSHRRMQKILACCSRAIRRRDRALDPRRIRLMLRPAPRAPRPMRLRRVGRQHRQRRRQTPRRRQCLVSRRTLLPHRGGRTRLDLLCPRDRPRHRQVLLLFYLSKLSRHLHLLLRLLLQLAHIRVFRVVLLNLRSLLMAVLDGVIAV